MDGMELAQQKSSGVGTRTIAMKSID